MTAGCAQISILTGGAKDEFAPTIDSAKTFPINGQVNFDGTLVHLRFDEYITLVKPNDNIIITPRPTQAPTITAHNKVVEIQFNEPLLENTTYTINFNRAVADITERNDSIFQYVFSTGAYIDSLSVRGQITDGFTNRGSADFLVALYPMQNEVQFDSVPYKQKPTYISQTDGGGNFRLNYLKYGVYHLVAIQDKNKNLLLDSDEMLAFLPEQTILVNAEGMRVSMKSFAPLSGVAQLQRTQFSAPGKLELIFSAVPDTFAIHTSCELLKEETGSGDSLVYWLSTNPTPKMRFPIVLNETIDTLKPVYKNSQNAERTLGVSTNLVSGKLLPEQQLEITFSEPFSEQGIDPEKIWIRKADSTRVPVNYELKNLRTLVIKQHADVPLTLVLDSAAVTSIYGTLQSTRVEFGFEHFPLSHYGSLIVNTDSVFTSPVLVYLLDKEGRPVDTANYAKQMVFDKLTPGEYQLRLVVDADGSGSWTSGSLTENRIPEKVIYFNEAIQVKSKWEKEVDWLLKSSSN